ncbi:MAG: hypothetical protein HQK53_14700, partial [Oligoflexia bacterium]|nr:hypothetical protein [Oligoflexia bacterium]
MIIKNRHNKQTRQDKPSSGKINKSWKLKVEEYHFSNFNLPETNVGRDHIKVKDKDIEIYEVTNFEDYETKQEEKLKFDVRREMEDASDIGFKISPIVERYRGIKKQEVEESQEKFEIEVRNRVEMIKAQWMQLGYNEGKDAAYQEVTKENAKKIESRLVKIEEMVNAAIKNKQNILEVQKQQLYAFIKSLVKWVILRELK